MKAIVIFNSQTGFTRRYAEWIREGTGAECVSVKEAAKLNLMDYDAIVYGGWCMAGSVTKLGWFKKQMPALAAAGKKLIIFAVGATPAEAPAVQEAMTHILTDEDRNMAKLFYCPGGLDYDKMNGLSRFMMKMLARSLRSKKDATEDEKKQAEMIAASYDIADKKFAEPIIEELKEASK